MNHFIWLRLLFLSLIFSSLVFGDVGKGRSPARTVSTIGSGSEINSEEILEKFSLLQNYPNPFNPVTKISYQLPVTEKVLLKIYDVRGIELITLVDETQQSGTYEVPFDATKLSSGVYFYRLTAGKYSAVRKLVITK